MGNYPAHWRASLAQDGLANVNKFGFTTGCGTTEVTVWAGNNTYAFPAAAAVMKVTSASTADQAGSSGARTLTIEGLNGSYAAVSETVNLNGPSSTAPALTTNSYLRVNRAYVATAGAVAGNKGAVYVGTGAITAGAPANKYAVIPALESQTLQAVYTVPAGKKALIENIKFSGTAAAKVITARTIARPFGGVFRTQEKFSLPAGAVVWAYDTPKTYDEKTDLEVRAYTSVGTESVSASMDIALVPKESTA